MLTLMDTAYHSGPLGLGKRLETGHHAFPVSIHTSSGGASPSRLGAGDTANLGEYLPSTKH